jgi:putative endonuclease
MLKHKQTGLKGEQIAADFLLDKGYIILFRNWRHGQKEVDVIAQKGKLVAFVEIKTRGSYRIGFPEEAVTARKKGYLKTAAAAFAATRPQWLHIRFDIISILMEQGITKEIIHFEDAFG